MNLKHAGESGLQTRLVAYGEKWLMPFQSLSWFEINGLPDLQSFNRWFTWNQMLPWSFHHHFHKKFHHPCGNSPREFHLHGKGWPRYLGRASQMWDLQLRNLRCSDVGSWYGENMWKQQTCWDQVRDYFTRFLDESCPLPSFRHVPGICFNLLQVFTDWPRFV